jgi:DNA-binding CsgD family transcriptional regulator
MLTLPLTAPALALSAPDPAPPLSAAPTPPSPEAVTGLLRALDTLEAGFVFLDRDRRVRHATPALREMLADAAFQGLDEELHRFATLLWGAGNVRRLVRDVHPLERATVRIACGECRLLGTFVGIDIFGDGPSVLVGVGIGGDAPVTLGRLRERFGLTPSQGRVALLLLQGLRNDEIGRRLCISAHTARHHVEQVRLKVGGHTRAAVASRIRQVAAP